MIKIFLLIMELYLKANYQAQFAQQKNWQKRVCRALIKVRAGLLKTQILMMSQVALLMTDKALQSRRQHDISRSKSRAGSVKQVRFKDVDELLFFDALLSKSGCTAVGIFREWIEKQK